MPSYNEVDGVPSHVNRWLLEDVLRREWGFQGLVVSDYYAIEQLVSRHHVARDKADAARQALEAGVDIELPDPDGFPSLVAMVKDGRVAEARRRSRRRARAAREVPGRPVRASVRRTPTRPSASPIPPASQALALEAARKSIVLLKNAGGLLPLDRAKLKTLAVIGPNAKGLHLGGYSQRSRARRRRPQRHHRRRPAPASRSLYAEGVRITEHDADWSADKVVLGDPAKNRERIQDGGQGGARRPTRSSSSSAPTSRRRARRGPTTISATSPTSR